MSLSVCVRFSLFLMILSQNPEFSLDYIYFPPSIKQPLKIFAIYPKRTFDVDELKTLLRKKNILNRFSFESGEIFHLK